MFPNVMVAACLLTFERGLAPGAAQERPDALMRMEAARERLHTGCVEFSWRSEREGRTVYHTARFGVRGDVLVYRGDDAGSGASTRPGSVQPRMTLKLDDDTWVNPGDALSAKLFKPGPRVENIWRMRALGVSYWNSFDDLHDSIWRDKVPMPAPRRYSERVEDGLHVVTAETEYGQINWWIDPNRDWSPVRVTLVQDGVVVRESRSTLREYDGVWFPAAVAFFERGFENGERPAEIVTVLSAEFDRSDHPRFLGPADIGIETGMIVELYRPNGSSEGFQWDGEKPVSLGEFARRERAGQLRRGPTHARELARLQSAREQRERAQGQDPAGPGGAAGAPDDLLAYMRAFASLAPDLWERYTRDFIDRYGLDDEQAARALAILDDCKELAHKHLTAHAAELHRLHESIDQLRAAQASKERLDQAIAERDQLVAPLIDIFKKQLVPRLDRLPTRAQREAAEGSSGARRPAAGRAAPAPVTVGGAAGATQPSTPQPADRTP